MPTFMFRVEFHGDASAGLSAFYDVVNIWCDYGPAEEDVADFTEHMRHALAEWYDVAGVLTEDEWQRREKQLKEAYSERNP